MMRIYTGSDADLILKPFMVKLSEIKSVKLDFYTDDKYSVVKESTKSGVTMDAEAGTITAHLTSDETTYFSEGVLNVQMSYRISDETYPDGTYDGIITIPQQYYVAKSSDTSGKSIDDVYESGYTAGEENAYANSVRTLNGQKGDLNLKTVNGNDLLGEGNIEIQAGGGAGGKKILLNDLTQDEYKAIREKVYAEMKASGHTEDTYYYKNDDKENIEITSINYREVNNVVTDVEFSAVNPKKWKLRINENNEFGAVDNGSKITFDEFESDDVRFCTVSVQAHLAGDETDQNIGYHTSQYLIFYGSTYGYTFNFYIRNGFGSDSQSFTTAATANVEKDGKVKLSFIHDGYTYVYQLGQWNEQDGQLSFISKIPIGGGSAEVPTKTSQLTNDSNFIASTSISKIVVLLQTEYDALSNKDEKTMYCIKS